MTLLEKSAMLCCHGMWVCKRLLCLVVQAVHIHYRGFVLWLACQIRTKVLRRSGLLQRRRRSGLQAYTTSRKIFMELFSDIWWQNTLHSKETRSLTDRRNKLKWFCIINVQKFWKALISNTGNPTMDANSSQKEGTLRLRNFKRAPRFLFSRNMG